MAQEEFPVTWETAFTNSNLTTLRIRVIGGWLVVVRDSTNNISNLTFLADPQHEWVLTS